MTEEAELPSMSGMMAKGYADLYNSGKTEGIFEKLTENQKLADLGLAGITLESNGVFYLDIAFYRAMVHETIKTLENAGITINKTKMRDLHAYTYLCLQAMLKTLKSATQKESEKKDSTN